MKSKAKEETEIANEKEILEKSIVEVMKENKTAEIEKLVAFSQKVGTTIFWEILR